METKIKWNEGEGYITATYEGSGNGSASISSDVNEGIDREQSIKVETIDKSVSATLLVSQEGLREVFAPSDGDLILADGGTFNVLKGEEGEVNLISFTIEHISYQAEEGMTWGEWCNSKYNTVGHFVSNGKVFNELEFAVVRNTGYSVLADEVILSTAYYYS